MTPSKAGTVRKAIEALKMSDREIGDAVGVHERTVRRWKETGSVRRRNREKLANLLRSRGDMLHHWADVLEAS